MKPDFSNQLDKYAVHEIIGEGGFGKVCRATRVRDGKEFAIKCLKRKNISNMIEVVNREVKTMQAIPTHKHCVNMVEVLQSDSYVFIVVELVKGGQLFDIIQKAPRKRLSEDVAREYLKQIIAGLEFLHKHKIVHRDLKLENILVHEDGYVLISDFGLSGTRKELTNKRELKDIAGSPNYVAPEILSGRGYDGYAADIWSTGVILFAMLAGFLPFEDDDFKNLFKKIVDCDMEFPKWFSVTAVHLLAKIFVVDPEQRITLKGIKEHAFYLGLSAKQPTRGSSLRVSLSTDIIPQNKPLLNALKSMGKYSKRKESEEEVNASNLISESPRTLETHMTNYEEDMNPKVQDTPTEKMTFFDLMGKKFNNMMTNVLRRPSNPNGDSNEDLDPVKLDTTQSLPGRLVDGDEKIDTRLRMSRSRSVPEKRRKQ